MRSNLVIVRCGRNSLHPRWLENGAARNWDLMLCPYQDGPTDSDFPVPAPVPGQKWSGLERLLKADDLWRRYEYIWLPDDDLLADAAQISRFFDLCRRFGATLAQPALTEDSYFSLPITMRNRAFFARATTYVEIMAPCFRRDVLERVLPTLADTDAGWGWGLAYVWAKAVDYRGIYIFDAAPVRHTRPVGQVRSAAEHDAARADWVQTLTEHNLAPIKRTLYGCDETGARIPLDQARFLLDYVGGYEYLIERDPRMLLRIAKEQLARRLPVELRKRRTRGVLRRWWRRLVRGPKVWRRR